MSGTTLSGSIRTIRYVMWSSILVNWCPVPAGITKRSPAASSCVSASSMSSEFAPGPFRNCTA